MHGLGIQSGQAGHDFRRAPQLGQSRASFRAATSPGADSGAWSTARGCLSGSGWVAAVGRARDQFDAPPAPRRERAGVGDPGAVPTGRLFGSAREFLRRGNRPDPY